MVMRCDHCGGRFIAGVVGSTPWPAHVCPDGTRLAPATHVGVESNTERKPE